MSAAMSGGLGRAALPKVAKLFLRRKTWTPEFLAIKFSPLRSKRDAFSRAVSNAARRPAATDYVMPAVLRYRTSSRCLSNGTCFRTFG
ncbi:hypothetical protein MPTK1_6g10080 [Marchantia polymorpha subsp. ruderalis]|uniref:Uncharacterized protein n=2 Tax=Marchantia polymorpha TaxID=3197 RepID=A0AAF6BQG5_MARPO|nr:hypothetical protein MARPO_0016s0051 [Marchantia polymorpha]BBN14249.1 hypothetical protein Mp_6g10080 [Marchantia polymorpha subsp. ruderalis]|eukprot:PTQ44984.1 hypothetical protein MARPO_0016s0051 [Marchantia polymorpha]